MKIKDFFRKHFGRKSQDMQSVRLRNEYSELLNRLSEIRLNFNFTDNPSQIDALIYEENAVLCRLKELYRSAKSSGMKLEAFEFDNIKKVE